MTEPKLPGQWREHPVIADTAIRPTCADYARLAPLMIGDQPKGVTLTLIHGTGGDWPARAEMLRRAISDPSVDGGEASMAGHLRRIDNGDAIWLVTAGLDRPPDREPRVKPADDG